MTTLILNENKKIIEQIVINATEKYEITQERAMDLIFDEMNLDYSFTENIYSYCQDCFAHLKPQKKGIAEMISEINDHKHFNLLSKTY